MHIVRTSVVAASVLALAVVTVAPSALAVSGSERQLSLCGEQSAVVQVGDHVIFTNPVGCSEGNAWANQPHMSNWQYPNTPPLLWALDVVDSTAWAYGFGTQGTCAVAFAAPDADLTTLASEALSHTGLPICPFVSTSSPDSQQALEYEAVGKTGQCDAAGGWAESWQEWADGGAGGPVCQRTLLYSDSDGKWVVGMWSESMNKYLPNYEVTR